MAATGDPGRPTPSAPLEANPADVLGPEDLGPDLDPEAPLVPPGPADIDLSRGSEADLTEQLYELPYDDDVER